MSLDHHLVQLVAVHPQQIVEAVHGRSMPRAIHAVMLRSIPFLSALFALVGCGSGDGGSTANDSTGASPCTYPGGAVEPMALNQVLTPYSWPDARHRDGRTGSIDLEQAHCDQGDIDWSPFDVLLFVSLPAF